MKKNNYIGIVLVIVGLLFIAVNKKASQPTPEPTVQRDFPVLENIQRSNRKESYSEVDRVAALTFDDGPNPEYTRQVLDILDKYDVKGTFFVLGEYAELYPEIIKEIHDRGHWLGSHSYSHADMMTLDAPQIQKEIGGTVDIIEGIIGEEVEYLRLPYGSGNEFVVSQVPELKSIMWNVDSEDWAVSTKEEVYNNVASQLTGDDLILFHDRLPHTVEALEMLIPRMIEAGYFFDEPSKLEFDMEYF